MQIPMLLHNKTANCCRSRPTGKILSPETLEVDRAKNAPLHCVVIVLLSKMTLSVKFTKMIFTGRGQSQGHPATCDSSLQEDCFRLPHTSCHHPCPFGIRWRNLKIKSYSMRLSLVFGNLYLFY